MAEISIEKEKESTFSESYSAEEKVEEEEEEDEEEEVISKRIRELFYECGESKINNI